MRKASDITSRPMPSPGRTAIRSGVDGWLTSNARERCGASVRAYRNRKAKHACEASAGQWCCLRLGRMNAPAAEVQRDELIDELSGWLRVSPRFERHGCARVL